VQTYLPDFKVMDETASSQATIRHLLTHMGGWVGDFFHDTGVGDDALNKYIDVMADLEQLAPLGTVWSYNNAGFSVAGGIIEAVTGTSYQAALKELLLQPLGLQTAYLDAGEVMTHRFVVGHRTSDDGVSVARPWPLPRSIYPVGGLICHVPDLLRYARFHLGDGVAEDGTRLLSAEAMTQMQTPQVTVWGRERWGLTWAVEDIGEVRQVSHSGGTVGQVTLLLLIPEHNFAIAVLTNANWGGAVTRQISRRALQQFLGIEVKDPMPIPTTEAELRAYVGQYQRPYAELELGLLNGKLIGQLIYKKGFPNQDMPPQPAPPPMTLALCENERLLVMDGPLKDTKADVIRQPDGTIGWLRVGGRVYVRQA
jgi:CubicO group peptidase (beta-lactamase class C family)